MIWILLAALLISVFIVIGLLIRNLCPHCKKAMLRTEKGNLGSVEYCCNCNFMRFKGD